MKGSHTVNHSILCVTCQELRETENDTPEEPENTVATQTDIVDSDMVLLTKLPVKVKELSTHVTQLKKTSQQLKIKCSQLVTDNSNYMKQKKDMEDQLKDSLLDEDTFKEDNDKVLFYTGLTNCKILFALFYFLHPHIAAIGHTSLSPFQQLLLTLMRLRLSLPVQDLGYRFGVHKSTVCRIFSSVLDVMFVLLKFLIIWPERDILRKTLPMDFRKHCPRCVVIIDCFEVFIDRPTDLLARA